MTDTMTPICDLIAELLSEGLSPDKAIAAARKVEATLGVTARSSGPEPSQREIWRVKKANQRARQGDKSPRTKAEGVSSNHQLDINNSETESRVVPDVPGDDWPTDYVEQFWKAFPPFRRQAKAKVAAKLGRIRTQTGKQKVTWATLFGGVQKFAATNPGEYAPAPMVWLNDGRWDREYGTGGSNGTPKGTGGGKVGFSGIGARLRQRIAEEAELSFEQSPSGPGFADR